MPIYVYRGVDCPHEFEIHQSFSEDPLTECTVCGKAVRRVFHPTGLVFKGSGWYITDSRKSNQQSNGGSAGKTSDTAATAKKTDSTTSKETSTASAAKD